MDSGVKRARRYAIDAALRVAFRSKTVRRMALKQLFQEHFGPKALGFAGFSDHGFFVDPKDHMIGFKLLCGEAWQRDDLEAAIACLRQHDALRQPAAFIDVGANIGTQTVYALLSGVFATALAIEPEPGNFSLLTRNLAENGLEARVRTRQVAAGSSSAELTLFLDSKNAGAHSLVGIARPAGAVSVRTEPLDELAVDIDPGLIWIDVEGYELEVLRGMPKLLEQRVPLCFEFLGCTGGDELHRILRPHYSRATTLARIKAGQPMQPLGEFVFSKGDVLVF